MWGDPRSIAAAFGGDPTKARFAFVDGPRYTRCARGESITKRGHAECDLVDWETPSGVQMIVHVIVPCPRCSYPMAVAASQGALAVDEDGRLTLRMHLRCPAHWPGSTAVGAVTGQYTTCRWEGVIREGHAHNPRCPAANFQSSWAVDQGCPCGGILTEAESVELSRRGR